MDIIDTFARSNGNRNVTLSYITFRDR